MKVAASILLCILGLATIAAGAPSKSPAPSSSPAPRTKGQQEHERYKNTAPADQYFGRMKLSYLGINNTFRDAAISSGEHTTDQNIANKVATAENALTDWEQKYPRDPQLPRTYFLAIRSEQKIWLQPNQERAWTYMSRILSRFPDSYFGKLVKKDMGIGFTEHYYAEAVPCPIATPTPTPAPVVTLAPVVATTPASRGRGRGTPTPSPTLKPAPTATPSPEPTPTPIPRPKPTQLAKGLSLQIEIPPCTSPSTPAPASTTLPTAPATALPTARPASAPPTPAASPHPSSS